MHNLSAYIFCSGHGSRLKPLTDKTPKPLIPWTQDNESMLELNIRKLIKQNVEKIFISYSYRKDEFLKQINSFKKLVEIELVYEKTPIGHGKSIQNCFLQHPEIEVLLGQNGDSYTKFMFKDTFFNKFSKDTNLLVLSNKCSATQAFPIVCDQDDNIVGVNINQSIRFYSEDIPKVSKFYNNIGTFLFSKTLLETLNNDEFIGFFGENDLIEQARKGNLLSKCIYMPEAKHYTFNTLEEYNKLKGSEYV
ncbi:hypothetical protein K8R14_04060 [bacterium]|nr:hypothetical protein [bacterium]